MARVTRDLAGVRPTYRRVRPSEIPDLLASGLRAPVVLTSHGPTRADKVAHRSLAVAA
jgi:hypothetical protein